MDCRKSAYSGLTKKYPDNVRFWFRLGTAQKSLGEFDAAVESFKRAETAGAPKSLVRYALAETRAKKGNTVAAFSLLEEALAAGYAMPDQLSCDPDFSSLRSDTRFAALVERAKRAQTPCRYAPEYRQFDFWIGEWPVTKAKDESPAGDSRMELSLGDCVIVENWTSKNTTYAGKSYNVYNTDAKRWEQFWVDNSAGMIHFIGSLKDGAMDFYTEDVVQPDGTTYKRHLRLFRAHADMQGHRVEHHQDDTDFSVAGLFHEVGEFSWMEEAGYGLGQVSVSGRIAGNPSTDLRQHRLAIKPVGVAEQSRRRLGEFQDGQASARLQDAQKLAQTALIVRQISKPKRRGYQIERRICERQA